MQKNTKIRLLLPLRIQVRGNFEGTKPGTTHRVSLLDTNPKTQRHHFWKYFQICFQTSLLSVAPVLLLGEAEKKSQTPWLYLRTPWVSV